MEDSEKLTVVKTVQIDSAEFRIALCEESSRFHTKYQKGDLVVLAADGDRVISSFSQKHDFVNVEYVENYIEGLMEGLTDISPE